MSRFVTDQARLIEAKPQQYRNTCWLGCYKMLILGSNNPRASAELIEKRLKEGGVNVKEAKSAGLSDSDFPKAAKALKMKASTTGVLTSIKGLLNELVIRGALWTAVRISDGKKSFHHVVLLLGVDTEKEQAYYIDPWRETSTDTVKKQWVPYKSLVKAIKGTKSVTAGCQSITGQTLT